MAKLEILIYPDSRLREKCLDVPEMNDEIRQLMDDMAETMYQAPGIGLAAAQVGSLYRVIVVDIGGDDESGRSPQLFQLANPRIVKAEGAVETEEGCLSIPDVREYVPRSECVTIAAINREGEEVSIDAEGLLAICFQHEIDHLDGILFIDRLSKLKRSLLKAKLQKFIK